MNSNSYKLVLTEDGSPSLEFLAPSGALKPEEKMHSWEGAFSETVFVYGAALDWAFECKWPIQVFSLGLGLGYNEIMTAAFCLNRGVSNWRCLSFESDPWLIEQFKSWIYEEPSELTQAYDEILRRMSEHQQVDSREVRVCLQNGLDQNRLVLESAYTMDFDLARFGVTVCFYDAFSEKVSPLLWTEEILNKTILGLAPGAVFATYAAKGRLNRALKANGFSIQERSGFGKKKQSTLAIRTGLSAGSIDP